MAFRDYYVKVVGIRDENSSYSYSRMRRNRKEAKLLLQNFYHFLSGFKNLKKMCISQQIRFRPNKSFHLK